MIQGTYWTLLDVLPGAVLWSGGDFVSVNLLVLELRKNLFLDRKLAFAVNWSSARRSVMTSNLVYDLFVKCVMRRIVKNF